MTRRSSVLKALLLLCWLCAGAATYARQPPPQTQDAGAPDASRPEVTPTYVIGEVVKAGEQQLELKVASGVFTVTLGERTKYFRLKPGETKLSNAEPVTLTDVGVGDRVMVLGKVEPEQKSVPARHVIVMKREEISQKQQREREEWRRRGVTGRITAINPQTHELTVQVRAAGGERPLTVALAEKATLRRYAYDTVRFADAQPGTFDDLKVGDQLRALGEKSADGTRFTAEQLVSGSFQMIGGRVLSVTAADHEVVVRNLQTERPVTVKIMAGSTLRRMTPEHVPVLLQRRPPGDGPRGPAAAGGDDPIERLPAIAFDDIKEGDTVILSSAVGPYPARATAIVLVAGAEALIGQAPAGRQGPRGPNLSLGLPADVFDGIISP